MRFSPTATEFISRGLLTYYGGRPLFIVSPYRLTEEQSLKIATKLETSLSLNTESLDLWRDTPYWLLCELIQQAMVQNNDFRETVLSILRDSEFSNFYSHSFCKLPDSSS
jgi:hypothetical protein